MLHAKALRCVLICAVVFGAAHCHFARAQTSAKSNAAEAERWTDKDEWLSWDFRVVRPGEYDVLVVTSEQKYGRDWEGGHELLVETAGQSLRGKVERDGKEVDPANPYWPDVISTLGRLRVDKAGRYGITLKPQTLRSDKKLGLTLVSVRLVPVGS